MTAAGKKHLLTVLNYPGAGHLIEPPFSPHCRVARLNKKSTSCSVMPRKSSAFPSVNTWRTHGGVCVCFSYIGARGKNQTSLRRPGGRLVEDLGLPAASSVLHSLRQHGEEQRNKKISHLADCHLYICPHWDSAAAGNSREAMLNFWKLPSCFFMLFTF